MLPTTLLLILQVSGGYARFDVACHGYSYSIALFVGCPDPFSIQPCAAEEVGLTGTQVFKGRAEK